MNEICKKGEKNMEKNRVFEIIINLLEGIKNDNKLVDSSTINGKITLRGCKYLLNQTIRQYSLPDNHYFVSEKAKELWDKISTDNMFNYEYKNEVTKNVPGEVLINKYSGNEKKARKAEVLKYGQKFTYNDVFTDEHIVPVNNIIDELLNLSILSYNEIEKVLDKIYICKMLKSEDRAIKNQRNRSTDYREVVVFDYKEAEIKLLNFDYISVLTTLISEDKRKLDELSVEKCSV